MITQINGFLDWLEVERGCARNTLAAYNSDLIQLHRFLANREVSTWDDVTEAHLAEFLGDLSAHSHSPATVARKLATAKSFFHRLLDVRVIEADPTSGILRPKTRRPAPVTLSEVQVGRLLELPGLPLRDRAMMALLYGGGLRVSELIEADLEDLEPDSMSLRVGTPPARVRVVPIGPEAAGAIAAYLEQVRATQHPPAGERAIFLNYTGRRLTRQCVWQIVRRAAGRVGLGAAVTPHTLRHSRAAHLLAHGVDLRSLMELLGHADISTTQHYRALAGERVA